MDDLLNRFLAFTGKSLDLELSPKDLDTHISLFEVDSLDLIEYVLSLEDEFNARIDLGALPSDATWRQVFALVEAARAVVVSE
jgi:acyl carrier protein